METTSFVSAGEGAVGMGQKGVCIRKMSIVVLHMNNAPYIWEKFANFNKLYNVNILHILERDEFESSFLLQRVFTALRMKQ